MNRTIRLDVHGVKDYIRLECEGAGKGVVFHKREDLQTPYTTGDTIHFYEPNAHWNEEEWDMWLYEVYHEIGHESPENQHPYWKDMVVELGISSQSFFGSMLNLVSDHIQEHNRTGTYAGRDQILKRGRSLFTELRLLSPEVMTKPRDSKESKAFKVVAVVDAIHRMTWNEQLWGVEYALEYFEEDELDMYNQVIDCGVRIDKGKNEWDGYNITCEILKALGFDPEEEQEKGKSPTSGKGEGEGEEGEAGGAGDEGDEGDGSTKSGKDFMSEVSDMIFHTHYEDPKEGGYNTTMAGIHIEYDDSDWDRHDKEFQCNDPVIIDMKSGDYAHLGAEINSAVTNQYRKLISNLNANSMLADKVKMLLTSMKQVRWNHGMKRGRISSKNIWKGTKAGGYSQEVFKQRAPKLDMNTAVTVLADFSGSMGGDKYVHAAKAGVLLNEALVKIGVPIELLGFSEDYRGPTNVIMSPFHEISVGEDELTERYATAGNWMCQNSDGESIMWAYSRLIKRPEKRKVLIVLSDGSPAAFNSSGNLNVFTKKVVESIEEGGRAEIYGVGIMDSNVERFYKDHKVINDAAELEDLLIGLVKNKVIGV